MKLWINEIYYNCLFRVKPLTYKVSSPCFLHGTKSRLVFKLRSNRILKTSHCINKVTKILCYCPQTNPCAIRSIF